MPAFHFDFYNIKYLLNEIKIYIEQTKFTFSRCTIIISDGKTKYTHAFLGQIYLLLKSDLSDTILIETAKKINIIIENELKGVFAFSYYDEAIYRKWNEKFKRFLPVYCDSNKKSKLIMSHTSGRKIIHDKYKLIIDTIEKMNFNKYEQLLNDFFYICKELKIECHAHRIITNYSNELEFLFLQLYMKNFDRKIKNSNDFFIFVFKMNYFFDKNSFLINEKEFLQYMFLVIPTYAYDREINLSNNSKDISLIFSTEKCQSIIENLIAIKSVVPAELYPELNLSKPGLKILNSKHIFKITDLMIKNILSTMSSSELAVAKDLHRSNYYINKVKYTYEANKSEDFEKRNFEKFKSDLQKNSINDFSLEFLTKYSHQGALIGSAFTWYLTSMINEFKNAERMPIQTNNILIIQSIDRDTIKVTSIGIFSIKCANKDGEAELIASGIAFIFENTFKFTTKETVLVSETKLNLANMSEDEFINRILFKEIKKSIVENGKQILSKVNKINETNFIINSNTPWKH